jgi:outer membrane lipoprotein-sorting protein
MKARIDRTKLVCVCRAEVALAGVITLLLASPAMAKTIKEVKKELIEKNARLKSYTAKTKSKTEMDLGQGNKMKSESAGTMEWMRRKDPKDPQKSITKYRIESKDSSVTTTGGKETKSRSTMLSICDGKFIYTLTDRNGQKRAFKMKLDPKMSHDLEAMFKMWEKNHDLKLLPDEKIEKKDCYVIEATPKEKEGEKKAAHSPANADTNYRSRSWYRKDIGVAVKMVTFDKKNKPMMTYTTTDIKTNVKIKPERLEFKVPEGVQLVDMTKQQPPPTTEDSENRTTVADKKSDQKPAKEEEKKEEKAIKGLFDALR